LGKNSEENFTWYQQWDKVDFNMAEGDIKWFTETKLNITKNCIDRHLNKGDKTAIIFEPNNPAEEALHITYTDLHQRVCKKWLMFERARNNKR
jgi:acetyl-CoA synthetase